MKSVGRTTRAVRRATGDRAGLDAYMERLEAEEEEYRKGYWKARTEDACWLVFFGILYIGARFVFG